MRWTLIAGLSHPRRFIALFVVLHTLAAMPLGHFGCRVPLPADIQPAPCDEAPLPLTATTQGGQLVRGALLAAAVAPLLLLCCRVSHRPVSASSRALPPPTPPPRLTAP